MSAAIVYESEIAAVPADPLVGVSGEPGADGGCVHLVRV